MATLTLPVDGVLVPESTGRLSPAQYAQLVAGKHLYFYIAPQGPYRGHSGAAARNYRIAASRPHGYIEVGMSAKFFQMGGIARFPNFTALDNFYSAWHAQSNSGTLFKIMDNYVVPAVEIGVTGAVLAGFAPAIMGGSGAASMTPEAAGSGGAGGGGGWASGGAGGGGGWAGTVENALGTVKGVISGGLTLKSILSGQPAQPSPQNQQAVPVNQAAPFKVTPAEAGFGLGGLLLLLIFIL